MKNFRDSDYAANKYAQGIVYRFADQTVEITLEEYLRENPGKSKADFTELKALSDEMYFRQDRSDNAQSKKTVSLHALEETALCASVSPEDTYIGDETTLHQMQKVKKALNKLTDIQRKRYLLYTVQGLSTWQIADLEGTNQKSVYESLQAAEKKIKKVLAMD